MTTSPTEAKTEEIWEWVQIQKKAEKKADDAKKKAAAQKAKKTK